MEQASSAASTLHTATADASRYEKICVILGVAGLIVLALVIGLSRKSLVYDEPNQLAGVAALERFGLSSDFLLHLYVHPGPLYATVQYLFKPLTGLRPPRVRFVNFGFLLLTIGVLHLTLRLLRLRSAVALDVIGLPMIWVVAGLALTEMPAVFFYSLSILLLLYALRDDPTGATGRTWLALAGGLCFSLAVLGRQPLLTVLPAGVLLLERKKKTWPAIVGFLSTSLILPAVVFSVWGGLVPPKIGFAGPGLSVAHGLLGCSYAGAALCILAPRYLTLPWRVYAGILVGSLAVNGFFRWIRLTPMASVAKKFLPGRLIELYSSTASAMFLGLGVVFLIASLRSMYLNRNNRPRVFLTAAALLLLAGCAAQPVHFSSRYVAVATPLLVLVGAPQTVPSLWKCLRLAAGISLGLISLWSHLAFAVPREERPPGADWPAAALSSSARCDTRGCC